MRCSAAFITAMQNLVFGTHSHAVFAVDGNLVAVAIERGAMNGLRRVARDVAHERDHGWRGGASERASGMKAENVRAGWKS
jgi:hypothetical protein